MDFTGERYCRRLRFTGILNLWFNGSRLFKLENGKIKRTIFMSHYFKEGYHRLALLVGPTIVHINLPQKMANNNNKMKGLLKGLRYISQIFENEKEPEMQIGFPTDVKHVAHIGWDGPSVNSPSWMNEFKSPPSFSSSPINLNGETRDGPRGGEGNRRSSRVPELPKASRRQHLAIKGGEVSASDSPTRSGKSEKARHRRSSKNSSIREASASATDSPRQGRRSMDSSDSPARISADVPKKNRRKKSKESIAGGGGSSRSRNKTILASPGDRFMSPFSDPGPEPDPDKDTRTQLNCQKPPIFDDADEIKGLMT